MPSERRKKLVEYYNNNKIAGVELLVDNIWDPHNLAAILRSCDGFGISKVNLYYSYNPLPDLNKQGKSSSSSANQWVRSEVVFGQSHKFGRDEPEAVEILIKTKAKPILQRWAKIKKSEGYEIFGTSLQEVSQTLDTINFPSKFILVIGNEKSGISSEVEEICDRFVYIPMVGMVESYNVSVATAICLYEVFKQKSSGLKLRTEIKQLFGHRE